MYSETRAYLSAAGVVLALALTAHFALVFTTTGVALFGFLVSLHVVVDVFFHQPLPPGVILPQLSTFIIVWIVLSVAIFGLWGWASWFIRSRHPKKKPDSGLLTNTHRRKQNQRQFVMDSPFAFVHSKPFYATREDSFCVVAPSGSGKTVRFAVKMVAHAPGACITTSTRLDVFYLTARIRAKKGRALVFAPEYPTLKNYPNRVGVDIVAGCENPTVAMERADAIVNAIPLGDNSTNGGFFKQSAHTLLRCMMHAAALGFPGTETHYDMRAVIDWLQDVTDDTPYTILREHPDANHRWLQDLRKFARGDAVETGNNIQQTVAIILRSLSLDEILDAVCPSPNVEMLDLNSFVHSNDTLYLLSKKKGLAAPVITAIVESLVSLAMDAGERHPLDPTLSIVLDELCNVCPLPSAPTLMTDGRGHGIQTAAIIQGRRQCEERFGGNAADIIINLTSCLLLFGGSRDVQFLRSLSDLADQRSVTRKQVTVGPNGQSQSSSEMKESVFSVGAIHDLAEGVALMFYRNLPAATVYLPAWWEENDSAEYETSQREIEKLIDKNG